MTTAPKKKKPSRSNWYVELVNQSRAFVVYGTTKKEANQNADAVKTPGDKLTLYKIKYEKVKTWRNV